MLLKAGALSLALLLASRLLGLLRESALAASFGASGLADVAVLMLTLPDWVAGVFASGGLAYVLLPAWARASDAERGAIQRMVAKILLLSGTALAVALVLLRAPAAEFLAGGLSPPVRGTAAAALVWSAIALPAALVAALWITRLQHERDFIGMYSAGIVVNLVLLAVIAAAALAAPAAAVSWLGIGLLAAMGLRLAWLRWRLAPAETIAATAAPAALPAAPVWGWAILSAGLPLALPFVARSIASRSGEGALAVFNYAWKLVELPLLLAVQLVVTLAFPAIASALASASGGDAPAGAQGPVRSTFASAFAVACACTAGLIVGAPAVAQLLFGWGRMDPLALVRIAEWARIGAWGLLPQALIAVGFTVLAARGTLKRAVLAYAFALVVLLALGAGGVTQGADLMMALNILLALVAVVTLFALGPEVFRWLPWGTMAASAGAVAALAVVVPLLPSPTNLAAMLVIAGLCAGAVLLAAWLAQRVGLRSATS